MMKMLAGLLGRRLALSLSFALPLAGLAACSAHAQAQPAEKTAKDVAAAPASGNLVPLMLNLPAAAFKGTPKDLPSGPNIEKLSDKPRPPMLVPPGLKNVAPGAKLTCSDKNATPDMLAKITDGNKEGSDDAIIFLRKNSQWVQMDLGRDYEIFAIVIWHAHNTAKIYHGVIVQAADDPDFINNVRALFNNDADNSSGLGVGTDKEYVETNEGKLINAKGVKARYLRFYSRGSTESLLNEYTEIEVYGRPPEPGAQASR